MIFFFSNCSNCSSCDMRKQSQLQPRLTQVSSSLFKFVQVCSSCSSWVPSRVGVWQNEGHVPWCGIFLVTFLGAPVDNRNIMKSCGSFGPFTPCLIAKFSSFCVMLSSDYLSYFREPGVIHPLWDFSTVTPTLGETGAISVQLFLVKTFRRNSLLSYFL